jgi:DNA-binding GntR family transcriptional regulator
MKPVIRRSATLREQVFDAVFGMLRNGDFSPGTRITEESLAETLGVSRTPIREAVGQLARQGLLVGREGGGFVVPTPTVEQIHQIIAVRQLIEPAAVRMAAMEYGPEQIERISKAIADEQDAVGKPQPAAFARANEAFRSHLFDAISNTALSQLIAQFDNHLNFIRAVTLKDMELRQQIVDRQLKIRDAVKKRDGDRAEALWRGYLSFTEVVLVARVPACAGSTSAAATPVRPSRRRNLSS